MKPQQLISAGFAITALAAASIPTLGWTDFPSLFGEASISAVTVALTLPDVLARDETPSP
jgi:hypothetical protein